MINTSYVHQIMNRNRCLKSETYEQIKHWLIGIKALCVCVCVCVSMRVFERHSPPPLPGNWWMTSAAWQEVVNTVCMRVRVCPLRADSCHTV